MVKKHPFVEWRISQDEVENLQKLYPKNDFSTCGLRYFPEIDKVAVTARYVAETNSCRLCNLNLIFPRLAKLYSDDEINDMALRFCEKNHYEATEENMIGLLNSFQMDF